MTVSDRFRGAAIRIMDGDDSMAAARTLEGGVLDEYPGDERMEDLLEGLAMYSPGAGMPYIDARELRRLVSTALQQLV